MKNNLNTLTMNLIRSKFILFFILFGASIANATPVITGWGPQIRTSDGKILVSQTASTNVNFIVDVTRYLINGSYESVSMNLTIVYMTPSGAEEVLSPTYTITSADFNSGFCEKQYYLAIAAGKVGGYVKLKYTISPSTTPAFAGTSFQTTDTPPAPTGYSHIYDGSFYRYTPDGKIYIIIEGVLRHIVSASTLNGIFSISNSSIIDRADPGPYAGAVFGNPIENNCELLNNTVDGKAYWAEGTVLRWITSMDVKNKYHFNWNSIRNINGTAGYTIGAPLY